MSPDKTKLWIVLGAIGILLSHVMFGLNIVFTRVLQHGKVVSLPSFVLLTLCNGFILLCYLPIGIWRFYKLENKKQESISYLKNWIVYAFALSMTFVVMFKMLASKYTSAIFVQLILQMTPFLVTIISFFILREKITKLAVLCLILTIGGGVLVMLAGSSKTSTEKYQFHWIINFSHLGKEFTMWDLLGIGMGVGASLMLATFMISVKYATSVSSTPIHEFSLLGSGVFFSVVFYAIMSLVFQENWKLLALCGTREIINLICFGIVTLLGLFLDMFAIPIIGASWSSSVLALRLVTTVVASWPILGEAMDNLWQFVGCVVVIAGVSVFLIVKAWKESSEKHKHDHVPVKGDVEAQIEAEKQQPEVFDEMEITPIGLEATQNLPAVYLMQDARITPVPEPNDEQTPLQETPRGLEPYDPYDHHRTSTEMTVDVITSVL